MKANIKVNPKVVTPPITTFGNIDSCYGANNIYFTKNGNPYMPISGEMHFSRCDRNMWELELRKIKASGVNAVANYIFWNHHEYNKGEFNFSGNNDIKSYLETCAKVGIPCILRIGPWAHGECLYGGFPPYVQRMFGKRKSNEKYLAAVKIFWTKLYQEVKEFCDGKTVLGIQLENEYCGSIDHIHRLREMAIEIGFKTPFFTMTAWPTNTPDKKFLPTFGAYPEAPWTFHKKRLTPAGRFAICEGRMESDIGEDLIKTKKPKCSFVEFPYAGCEVGVGNQVTQHRRPIMSREDGYGIAFAKLASGMNWIGYYMYHGGRNPVGRLLQESKRSLYPNNYPIIDYDFQSPFGKNGEKRVQCDSIRLMHTFATQWDKDLVCKQAFFGDLKLSSAYDNTVPYYSVRCDENLSGYMFISNYERSRDNADINDFVVCLSSDKNSITLPSINIKANAIFFYPFNFSIGEKHVDYVLAQPIAKDGNKLYFSAINGIKPTISIGGVEQEIKDNYVLNDGKNQYTIIVLDEASAMNFYKFDKVAMSSDTLYEVDGVVYSETKLPPISNGIKLTATTKKKLPHNHYLFSCGKRKYYSLEVDKELLNNYDDIQLELDFTGLNLQVFSDDLLVDDYFNTDGKCIIRLAYLAKYLNKNNILTIKTSPPTKHGVGRVYNELGLKVGENELNIASIIPLKHEKFNK